jgi:ribokinase
MVTIICIGSACKDVFFPTAEGKVTDTPEDLLAQKKIEFELGAKYKIETRFEALGGCAANVACGLSKLGIKTACYSHIGDDYIADWIKKELEKNEVDTDFITQENNTVSDMSAIIVDKESGERVIFSNQKANSYLGVAPEKIKNTSWIFIGDLHGDWENNLDKIFDVAKENNIKIAFNPSQQANIHGHIEKVIECIPKTDIIFLNKDESIEIISKYNSSLNKDDLNSEGTLIKELQKINTKIAVITDGIHGAWVYDGKNLIHRDAQVVKAIDSTGAGDSFNSAFLSAYIKEKNLEECLKWGITNSSSVVQYYGAIEGLLDEEHMLKIQKE